jgi:DNA replication protein DnaC
MDGLPVDVYNVLSDRKSRSELIRDRLVLDLYARYPELEDLDRRIRVCSAERILSLLDSGDDRKHAEELASLREDRSLFIEQNKVAANYDKVIPYCDRCEDEGFLDGKVCECVKDLLIPQYRAASGLDKYPGVSFSSYTDGYFSEPVKMGPIHDFCVLYSSADFGNRPILLFWGKSGTGKTFMAICVARQILEQAIPVLVIRAPELMEAMDEYRTLKRSFSPDAVRDAYISGLRDRIFNADFLVIDELGVEAKGPNNVSDLLQILGTRQQGGKVTLITTNLSLSELEKHYDNRVYSRLMGDFTTLQFEGKDIRTGEKYRKRKTGGKI